MIDSAAKRRSASNAQFAFGGPSVTPDATPDGLWRASTAWTYGGVSGTAATGADYGWLYNFVRRRRRHCC